MWPCQIHEDVGNPSDSSSPRLLSQCFLGQLRLHGSRRESADHPSLSQQVQHDGRNGNQDGGSHHHTPEEHIFRHGGGKTYGDSLGCSVRGEREGVQKLLSLIHISEPTRLGMISYAVFCLK